MKKAIAFVVLGVFFAGIGYFVPQVLLNRDIEGQGESVNITKYKTAYKELENRTNEGLKTFNKNALIKPTNVFDKTIIEEVPERDDDGKIIPKEQKSK